MNKDKASLIGVLLSDGSIYFDKSKRTYCVQFTNKLNKLNDYFISLIKRCYGDRSHTVNLCSGAKSIRFFSKKIAYDLLSKCSTFRTQHYSDNTYPKPIIPKEIIDNEKLSRPFLRAYASCDGSVYQTKSHRVTVEIACANPHLRKQLISCISNLKIDCRETKKGIVISRIAAIQRFSTLVNFLPQSKVVAKKSKNFGIKKSTVLKECLNSPH